VVGVDGGVGARAGVATGVAAGGTAGSSCVSGTNRDSVRQRAIFSGSDVHRGTSIASSSRTM
jgi:hypothetical protein